jgi:hypothetical protein
MTLDELRYLLESFKFTNLVKNPDGQNVSNQEMLERVSKEFKLGKD